MALEEALVTVSGPPKTKPTSPDFSCPHHAQKALLARGATGARL